MTGRHDGLPERHLGTDRDVDHRAFDLLDRVLARLRLDQEVADLVEADRSLGEPDDHGLHLGDEVHVGQVDHPIRIDDLRPEPLGIRAITHPEHEGVCLVEEVTEHLAGTGQVVGADVEAVNLALLEHLGTEDALELRVAEPLHCGLVGDGEVVALESDAVDVRSDEVCPAEDAVLRVFMAVAGTTVLGVHQRQLLDDLLGQHLELRTVEHEAVHAVTEDPGGNVNVVSRKHQLALLVQVGQLRECDVHEVAHAPGRVQASLDRHRTADRQLEGSIRPLLEPEERATDHAVLRRIHEGIQLAGVAHLLLSGPGLGTRSGREGARCAREAGSGERVASHLFLSSCDAARAAGS